MGREPVSHISRSPLPWRDPADNDTECGKPVAEFAKVITWDDAVRMVKDLGQQRAALFLCMTCTETAQRHRYGRVSSGQLTFDDEPTERLSREFGRRRDQTDRELRAMAEIASRHRQEFDDILSGLVTTIAELRRKKERA